MKLGLKIDIDEINYAQFLRAVLPYVKKEDIPLPEAVINAAEAPGVLENFLRFIPKEKQDEIVLKLVEKNKVRMIARAHNIADKLGVDVQISDISQSVDCCPYKSRIYVLWGEYIITLVNFWTTNKDHFNRYVHT